MAFRTEIKDSTSIFDGNKSWEDTLLAGKRNRLWLTFFFFFLKRRIHRKGRGKTMGMKEGARIKLQENRVPPGYLQGRLAQEQLHKSPAA